MKNYTKKTYIVLTKSGNSFQVEALRLDEAKQAARFNCDKMNEKVERVYLKK